MGDRIDEKTAFKEPQESTLKIGNPEPSEENAASSEPLVSGSLSSRLSVGVTEGGAAENLASASQLTESGLLDRIPQIGAPYRGLTRHKLVMTGCLCFSAILLAMSTMDLRGLLSTETTIDRSFHVTYKAKLPELAANLTYVDSVPEAEGLRAVVDTTNGGGRIGFVDSSGKVVIKPQFAEVGPFRDGLAYAKWPNKDATGDDQDQDSSAELSGYIDKSGNWVIQPQFNAVSEFENGVAAVFIEDERGIETTGGIIDKQGRFKFKGKLGELPKCIEGIFIVSEKFGKVGLLDSNGKWILPPTYDSIKPLEKRPLSSRYYRFNADAKSSMKYFEASLDGACGVIDRSGKVLIPLKFDAIDSYENGVAAVKQNDRYGFADKSGRMIIEATYDEVSSYADLIAARIGTQWLLLDSQGQQIKNGLSNFLPVSCRGCSWFANGRAPVMVNGKVGYLNAQGQWAIAPRFKMGTPFNEGYAVAYSDRWHYIDVNGNVPTNLRFVRVELFSGGTAGVCLPGPLNFLETSRDAAEAAASIEDWRKDQNRPSRRR